MDDIDRSEQVKKRCLGAVTIAGIVLAGLVVIAVVVIILVTTTSNTAGKPLDKVGGQPITPALCVAAGGERSPGTGAWDRQTRPTCGKQWFGPRTGPSNLPFAPDQLLVPQAESQFGNCYDVGGHRGRFSDDQGDMWTVGAVNEGMNVWNPYNLKCYAGVFTDNFYARRHLPVPVDPDLRQRSREVLSSPVRANAAARHGGTKSLERWWEGGRRFSQHVYLSSALPRLRSAGVADAAPESAQQPFRPEPPH